MLNTFQYYEARMLKADDNNALTTNSTYKNNTLPQKKLLTSTHSYMCAFIASM